MWKKGETFEVIHDPRGDIIPIAEGVFKSVMLIESKEGAVRANHWHKTDAHVMHIITGKAIYLERHNGVITERVMLPGESVFTGPGVMHAMKFPEYTLMVVCCKNPRDYDAYMGDMVKCDIWSKP